MNFVIIPIPFHKEKILWKILQLKTQCVVSLEKLNFTYCLICPSVFLTYVFSTAWNALPLSCPLAEFLPTLKDSYFPSFSVPRKVHLSPPLCPHCPCIIAPAALMTLV